MGNHEARYLQALMALAKITNTQLDPYMISRYDEALSPFGYENICRALDKLFEAVTPGGRMPTIGQIKTELGDIQFTDEEIARDAVQRVRYAIERFGGYRWPDAKLYIGEIGQHVVNMMGGWDTLCNTPSYKELDFALVQAREYVKGYVKKNRSGNENKPIELPEIKNRNLISLVSNLAESSKPIK